MFRSGELVRVVGLGRPRVKQRPAQGFGSLERGGDSPEGA
jgi:hypothetical protein